ncbi:mercury(II) reductase [Inquilinus sp. CAU 1745]|uniref:mercury(II) reductase n=1 Tax=Inquilinus sp. CAU 1745 TaxID=3140369 RepID=UPI00325B86D0
MLDKLYPHCCPADASGGGPSKPDLVVVGAGSAGFAAAIRAVELGARVALVGYGAIGGTCVNIGCVPSKTLIRAAEALHHTRTAPRFAGISAKARLEDWKALIVQKDELVASLRQAKYDDLLAEYESISYLSGRARLTDQGVEIDGRLLRTDKVVIATGASPAVPAIPGLNGVPWLTSTTAMDLEALPASLLVIGGGVVGVELGQMFARMGARVTIVCRSRLLPNAEPEVSAALADYLRAEDVEVRCGVAYDFIRRVGDGVELAIRDADGRPVTLAAERVLIATGRTPNTAGMGLETAGVALDAQDAVRVDDRLRTTRPGTYAAGDVTGRDFYVYMAAYGGRLAAENALTGEKRQYDASAMPEVTFTDPQAVSVGLTEAAAQRAGLDVEMAVLSLDQVPRALAARDTRGLIKLVAERGSGRLLGAHMLAPEAGDSIQTAVLAVKHGLTVSDLADTLFPYLTTVEGVKLGALSFAKDIKKLSCCAG